MEVTNTPEDDLSWQSVGASLSVNDTGGPGLIEFSTAFAFCRLVYTNISGTGTIGTTTAAGKRSLGLTAEGGIDTQISLSKLVFNLDGEIIYGSDGEPITLL